MCAVYFRLLGSVDAHVDGRPLPLGTAKQRCVLALLLLEPGAHMHIDRLTDLLWGEKAPASAKATLQVYVSRLRAKLAPYPDVTLATDGPCYKLPVDPGQVDLHQFRSLVAKAAGLTGEKAVRAFRHALGKWRGPALDDVAPPHLRDTIVVRLNDERIAAWEQLIDIELAMGNHRGVLPDLASVAEQHPLRERLAAQMMTALYQDGRRAEALAHYRAIRTRLSAELGIDPSAELTALHQGMLRDEPALGLASQAALRESVTSSISAPAQLPGDLATFTGRAADLKRLPRPEDLIEAVTIAAIDGMAGVGKTTLAVHWAHQLVQHFPDGQFFIDLHGHTPELEPTHPASALDRMLRDLGVPGERVPAELDERAALYRSTLATKRVLIVLDNVVSESQVRPLLPSTHGSLVIVTSRRRLTGLDSAHQLSMEAMPLEDAIALFARIAGPQVHDTEDSVRELVGLLGHLPLAVRIAAARLRARPSWTPADFVLRLRDQRRRLTELDVGDRGIAAAFTLSSQSLPTAARTLFRLLGLHPGAHFDTSAAAALSGQGIDETGTQLELLVDESLLLSRSANRYQLHDLLRVHAAERVAAEESKSNRRAALDRLLAYYAETAASAAAVLYPFDSTGPPAADEARFEDRKRAEAWLDAELHNLLATAAYAARNGLPDHPSQLSATLWRHLAEHSRFAIALELHGLALEAARRGSDRIAEANALIKLGTMQGRLGHYQDAADRFREALPLFRAADDRAGEVRTRSNLGVAYERLGRYDLAVTECTLAVAHYRASGDRQSEAVARLNLGNTHGRLGRYDEALSHFELALTLYRKVGNHGGEARALSNIGIAQGRLGHTDAALTYQEQALQLARGLGNRDVEGDAHNEVGNVLRDQGWLEQAIDHHQQALAIFRELGNRAGESCALNDLGRTFHALGRHADALACHRDSLPFAIANHDRYERARALDGIAYACDGLGNDAEARMHWRNALEIFADLNAPEAGDIHARLRDPG